MGVETARRKGSLRKRAPGPKKGTKSSKYFGKNGKKTEVEADEEPSEPESETREEEEDEEASEVESLDSDALDEEDEDEFQASGRSGGKRKRVASSPKKGAPKRKTGKGEAAAKRSPKTGGVGSARKKRKTAEEREDEESELELKEGQEVVGVVVKAPKTGRGMYYTYCLISDPRIEDGSAVPPGQISQNTLNFLSELKKPECNDREWYGFALSCNIYG